MVMERLTITNYYSLTICYMSNDNKRFKVTIYNAFFDMELTGEFSAPTEEEAIFEAKDNYSSELGTEPDEIKIVKVVLQ